MDSWTRDSAAVNRWTLLTNSWTRCPAFCSTSSKLHVKEDSTGETSSSTSGGSQRERVDGTARWAAAATGSLTAASLLTSPDGGSSEELCKASNCFFAEKSSG